MRTVEIKLYKFSELSESAKEKAIEKVRDDRHHLDYNWWEFVYKDFREVAKKAGFEVGEIYFSGFYSQGDGAMFEYYLYDDNIFKQFVEQLKLSPMRKQWILNNVFACAEGVQRGIYYHEKCCLHSIYWQVNNGDLHWSKNFHKWLESFSKDFEIFVINIYEDLCASLYKSLGDEYNYLNSDEAISNYLENNLYEFTEDGCIY